MTPDLPVRLLFVCVENSNRSQMAEAFARMQGADRVVAASAGSRPSGVVNPKAIAAMAELGYDLSTHRSTAVADVGAEPWDAVVTMGCGDACPWVPARVRDDWAIPDPRDLDAAGVRAVRDEIGSRVQALLASLGVAAAASTH
ncbi:MAG: arsenate reductase ArsC [Gemmatimonadota bacterium]|nr:arsenate reductase ArsC [Gemmatimonadota bacterium]